MRSILIHASRVMLLLTLVCFGWGAGQHVKNPVTPRGGEFVFPLKPVWRIEVAGERPFGNVVSVRVTDSGHVFARDLKNREYYAFDRDGRFLAVFGRQGEGPGQVRNIGGASIDVVGNKVIVEDPGRFHVYSDRGEYLESRRKTGNVSLILSEYEYISAPASIAGLSSDQATMRYVNLSTGERRVIADFKLFASGVLETGRGRVSVVMPSITPMMVFGRYKNRIYYGMNNDYTIHITDIEARSHGRFSLQREPERVSLEEREDVLKRLAKGYAPEEMAIAMAKTLPDRVTCFSSIVTCGDRLYLFQSHFVPTHRQEMDIVDPEGRYLYRGILEIEKGANIMAGPVFAQGHAFLVEEDDEGEISIVKYETRLPR